MEAENNTADEAANQPTEERIAVLGRLKAQLGDVPPHFWAASHFCDIQALELLVRVAELSPQAVHIVAAQSYSMVLACKY